MTESAAVSAFTVIRPSERRTMVMTNEILSLAFTGCRIPANSAFPVGIIDHLDLRAHQVDMPGDIQVRYFRT